jgi:hypothetical protein
MPISTTWRFVFQIFLRENDLVENFRRRKIPFFPICARRAKNASHIAARLGGYANRQSVAVFHHNAFHKDAVGETEKKFNGPVFRHLLFLNLGETKIRFLRQLFPQNLGKCGNFIKGRRAPDSGFQELFSR